jgi:hypothetical protein
VRGPPVGLKLPVLIVQRWLNVPARARELRPRSPSPTGVGLGPDLEAALTAAEATAKAVNDASPRSGRGV